MGCFNQHLAAKWYDGPFSMPMTVGVGLTEAFVSVCFSCEREAAQLTSAHCTQRNALVRLLHWTLSSNLHIANNKIIDRIVDHKHFTSFQIGFYSLFTTIRYLKCKVIFFTLRNCIDGIFFILYDIGKWYLKLNLVYSIEDFPVNPNPIHIFLKVFGEYLLCSEWALSNPHTLLVKI